MIDSHCHLAGDEFTGDLGEVVARAKGAGLSGALVILGADDPAELTRSANVSSAWDQVRFSVGVHPHQAGQFASDPTQAARQAQAAIDAQPLNRAVGEIGLDYHYDFAPREVQQQVFREQIRLAGRLRLPIVIHTREAEEDTFRILEEERAPDIGGGSCGLRGSSGGSCDIPSPSVAGFSSSSGIVYRFDTPGFDRSGFDSVGTNGIP
jgi:TatD DNase family protein